MATLGADSRSDFRQPKAEAGFKEPDLGTYFDFTPVAPAVQRHILKVYATLATCLLAYAVGAYAHVTYNIGGMLSAVGTLVCLLGLIFTPHSRSNEGLRLNLLLGTAFFKGVSSGPLLQAVADIDSSLISTALLASSGIFACFSAAALLAKRREFLYLGGLCGSALSLLLSMRLASFLFGTHVLQFQMELYLGLFIFAGYVVYDSQVMIERASLGSRDYISDALQLFLDFIAIFIRILIILAKQQGRNAEGERREKRDKRR